MTVNFESFAKVDKYIVIQAMTNYINYHDNWMIELKEEAAARLSKPYKHWFKTKTRTRQEVYKEMKYAEDYWENGWTFDIHKPNPKEEAVWLYQGNSWREKAKNLIKLANNSFDDFVYLGLGDNSFVSKWMNYKEEK